MTNVKRKQQKFWKEQKKTPYQTNMQKWLMISECYERKC